MELFCIEIEKGKSTKYFMIVNESFNFNYSGRLVAKVTTKLKIFTSYNFTSKVSHTKLFYFSYYISHAF